MIYNNILETVGSTPIVKLNSIGSHLECNLYAKLEMFNPGGSLKDRTAFCMIDCAEKSGRIKPGDTLIEATSVLSPKDLENEFGLTEGNLNHGEMTLDQFFFMRPTMSTAQYKSPIGNLYLCGSGTHPGGGLHGANGFNAAREILKG